ncbi:hypothetical protein M011DRAFT_396426 [Sporormia fimetaria CBS 119925]|uniref:G-protein coupled receptors family 2 profile 2 domain-containing protein n=1 Tax=Sporormia fimetaria CBS 119925 TaxID=1340428 RepID=A0A6A6VJ53_9PLEO|nr:hypothetical protein M011DRAFT_396426 [Sporormia fimetaria CBS 119925]
MDNRTLSLRGRCPAPFYEVTKFGNGGFVTGRFCAPVELIADDLVCCLPCPATDFLYPKEFNTWYTVAEVLNVVGLVTLIFLLLSFILLPIDKTRRHYLSYCLIVGGILMALGFVVPFGAKPQQCYDEITPNDMFSNLTCAFSGAFLISGGLTMGVWIFIRALSMHLQICWDVLPGARFFYWSQGLGWAVVATIFTATVTLTGFSFRFGSVCHVNSEHSMADFWGPLLAIAGAATLVQLSTFAYCIKVYIKNMWSDDKTETQSSAGLPSYTNSVRTRSARAVYRRVRKVLWLQWRGITIVVFILVDVIFFSVVFVYLNATETHAIEDLDTVMPFLMCLVANPKDPSDCHKKGQDIVVSFDTVIAVLMMLSLVGIQVFILLVRSAMFPAWIEFFRSKFSSKREFVSLDAKNYTDDKAYEMQRVQSPHPPGSAVTSPTRSDFDPWRRSVTDTPDHFNKEIQRTYQTPSHSFSTPRAPSRVEFDPRATHARGGLALHPINDEEDTLNGFNYKV